jgi:REP element-mobilizing transposase RayT
MTQPRETIVSVADTPYYHCVSRCVRRAFLCGQDHYSGKDYEHRRQWLEDKLHKTAKAFAIKLCAYAVMSNHYHVVLHIRPDLSNGWSDREVVKRWHLLFRGNLISQRYLANDVLLDAQRERLGEDIALWRERLCSPSWYMRIVNEAIARRANTEDNCKGRFWEGRFKSQALLDERALLACMAYVDLNPVRAKMAQNPEESEHTSVKARITALQKNISAQVTIAEFIGSNPDEHGLPFLLKDYLELTDWTGRLIREDKRGSIDDQLPPILERLSLTQDAWKILTTRFEQEFKQWVGSEHIVRQVYSDKKYQRIPSTDHHRTLLG